MPSRSLISVSIFIVACGGAAPEPQHVDTAPTATATTTSHAPVIRQELGSIDDRAVSNAFQDLSAQFEACQKSGLKHIPYLSGRVKFFMRVGEDGKTKWTYIEESNLGDYDTEKCMLDILEGASWPKPIGGDATVERDLTFDAPPDVRQPADWPSDKVAATLGKHKKEVDKCLEPAQNAKFNVTAYVEPHGKDGRVAAVGVATTTKEGAPQVKCIVDALKPLKMPTPGGYPAKVTFGL